MKKNAYLTLLSTKKQVCSGKKKAADLKAAASTYLADATAKGKTKAEAQKVIDRIQKMPCSVKK